MANVIGMRLSLALLAILITVTGQAYAEPDLMQHRWRSRVLLVFAPDAADQRLLDQMHAVDAAKLGFAERDLVLVEVVGAAYPDLRRRFGVAPGSFAVILLGKDGGEKQREFAPLASAQLFATIDQMPMRRQEARRKG